MKRNIGLEGLIPKRTSNWLAHVKPILPLYRFCQIDWVVSIMIHFVLISNIHLKWVEVLGHCFSSKLKILDKNFHVLVFSMQKEVTTIAKFYCVCLKSKTLCITGFLHLLHDFYRVSGESEQKIILMTIEQLTKFCCYKRRFFWSILFLNKSQRRGIFQCLLDKCDHLFICMSLKKALSSEQKSQDT